MTDPKDFGDLLAAWHCRVAEWLGLDLTQTYDMRDDTDDGYFRLTWGSLDRREPDHGHWRGWHSRGDDTEARFTGSVILSPADQLDLLAAVGEKPRQFTPDEEARLRALLQSSE